MKNVRQLQDLSTQIKDQFEEKHQEMSRNCQSLKLSIGKNKMLMVTIEGWNQIEFSERISLMNTNYELLSFSTLHSKSILKTTFKFKGRFYTSYNGSLPEITNLSELQNMNVLLFVKEGLKCPEIDLNEYIFNKNALDNFTKESYKFTNSAKYEKMKENRKEVKQNYDKKNDKSE